MELRVLNYFLATAQELNMTRAAEKLLVSQPALSRQIADLEAELGVKLFIRQPRRLILTSAGRYLQTQAKEILALADKTKQNLISSTVINGDLTIGAGESYAMQRILNLLSELIEDYPEVKVHLFSGDYTVTEQKLNNGTLDFAVIMGDLPLGNYESLQLPEKDRWGVLMSKDDELAKLDSIRPEDLVNRQILNSEQASEKGRFQRWFGNLYRQVNFVGTYNLYYNASLIAKNSKILILSYDRLANTSEDFGLVFRPLSPALTEPVTIIWKHETELSTIAQLFINRLSASIADDSK